MSTKKISLFRLCFLASFLLFVVFLSNNKYSFDLHLLLSHLFLPSPWQIALIITLGLGAVSLMTIYDFILRKEFQLNISLKDTFKIAWISNTVGHFTGENREHSGGISYLLYQTEGIDSSKANIISILKNTLFTTHDDSDFDILKVRKKTQLQFVGAIFLKWLGSACLFLYIFQVMLPKISLIPLLFIFSIAVFIGSLSNIAGGIGIFECIIILLCINMHIPLEITVAGLIVYRTSYYIVPWLITLFILALKPRLANKLKLSQSNKRILQSLSIQAIATLTLFAGVMLILVSSIPTINTPNPLEAIFPWYTIDISQFLGMGIGFLLVILSKGIYHKVASAYYLSLALLVSGVCYTLLRDFRILEAILITLITVVLYTSKEYFYRSTGSIHMKQLVIGFFYLLTISILYLIACAKLIQTTALSWDTILHFIFPQWQDILTFAILMGLGAALYYLMSPQKIDFTVPTDEDLEQLKDFLEKYPGNSMSHLLFLKDKSFYFAMQGQVLFAFRPYRNYLMVLGDPIGDASLFKEAINEFRIYADQYSMMPIFYEISQRYLPLYHENGLNFLKLGEEATMSLQDFTMVGKQAQSLRTVRNKMDKGEFVFELIDPPFQPNLLAQLKQISDTWLNGRSEKAFSLGAFEEDYLNLAPIAIVKKDDVILGFATIMPMYQEHIFAIDLMRLLPNPPNGTMEAIFLGIIQWGKEEGYTHFVLGKAPMSNVGVTQFSSKKEKLLKRIYTYGNRIYSFKGLRRFKEKFSPQWEGVYLAYPRTSSLPIDLLHLTRLISGADDK